MKNSFYANSCNIIFFPIRTLQKALLIVFILNLTILSEVYSQTTPLSFTVIPYSDPDIIAPRRGMEQWHYGNTIDPGIVRKDVYFRFTWNSLETSQGNYDWTNLDDLFNTCIDNPVRQKISFGIMTCFPNDTIVDGLILYGNGNSAYPEYLHTMMQAETVSDWKTTGTAPTTGYGSWVPNWNSPSYLSRLLALNQAVNNHINTTSHNNVAYKDIVNSIDIREYGTWGEWHSAGIIDDMINYPNGTRPTAATLKTIIDHHVNAFTDFPLSLMISVFDPEYLPHTVTPNEVTAYALGRSNNWGLLGWRRDNWGDIDNYFPIYLENNTGSYNGGPQFHIAIMERWKYAPITGEAPNWIASVGDCGYDDLERQVRLYHASSFGNGNFGAITGNPDSVCIENYIRAGAKAAGYRIILEGGSISSTISKGSPFALTLNWKNVGIAPTYEKWNVVYELKNSSNVTVWSDTSQFTPKLFLPPTPPSTAATIITDSLTIPSTILDGNYTLNMIIKDPTGYRDPLPLAITGRNTDGSYTVKNISFSSSTTMATLIGTVGLQGRPPAPNSQWQVPVQVDLYTQSNSTLAVSYTVTTDQSGQFVINNITPGTYHIGIKNTHTLRTFNISQPLVAGNNTVFFGPLREGDVDNNDTVLNFTDLMALVAAYNTAEGDPTFNPRADLNEDGFVTALDLGLLISNYNQFGDYITPGCPLVTATIGNTSTCDGSSFNLTLSAATGVGPFDLMIDGDLYSDIPVGGTIKSYTPYTEKMWYENPAVTSNEDGAVEVGVKFQTPVNGYVKGIRFFSPNNIAGTYTGHLWTAGGTLLASATFSNVTANGWQQVLFSQPVYISGSTVYVASYHTTHGRYASTGSGMINGFSNGINLVFPDNATAGGNGVYNYGSSPVFPSASVGANYWVDVLFTPGSYQFKLQGVTGNNGCNHTRPLQTLTVNSLPCSQGRFVNSSTAIENRPANIYSNMLGQNYPNPFNNTTTIYYTLAEAANVNLSVFDISGRLVKVVVNGARQAGLHTESLSIGSLEKGVYFYKIRAGNFSGVKKMIIQ